tara:strand:+ start:47 stop:1147 length:1101 start_codon:yes stop_codon:yes gene_type:complete
MNLKISLSIISLVLITACGPSLQEKEEIAIVTCNIMGESLNMNASLRIKEMNEAREKIKEKRFLEGNAKIKESFTYGLCKELVMNDSDYENKLTELKELERIAKEKVEKLERLAREKRDEEQRLAREKRDEEQRLAREKRDEEQRLATIKHNEGIKKYFEKYPPSFSLIDIVFDNYNGYSNNWLGIDFTILVKNACGFDVKLDISFKNGKTLNYNSNRGRGLQCSWESVIDRENKNYIVNQNNFREAYFDDWDSRDAYDQESDVIPYFGTIFRSFDNLMSNEELIASDSSDIYRKSQREILIENIEEISIVLTGDFFAGWQSGTNYLSDEDRQLLKYDNYGLDRRIALDKVLFKENLKYSVNLKNE